MSSDLELPDPPDGLHWYINADTYYGPAKDTLVLVKRVGVFRRRVWVYSCRIETLYGSLSYAYAVKQAAKTLLDEVNRQEGRVQAWKKINNREPTYKDGVM